MLFPPVNRSFPNPPGLRKANCFNLMKKPEMLLLQRLEIIVQLLVPWIENKDLECQGRRGHGEVGQGYSSGDDHGGKGDNVARLRFASQLLRTSTKDGSL